MPMYLVNALSDQILPIRAEERLEAITDVAVSSGNVKKSAANKHQRSLQRLLRDDRQPATRVDLESLGIEVVNG